MYHRVQTIYFGTLLVEEKGKNKGFCSNFTKSFGKVMEGIILWAKSDSNGLADAGVDIGN